MFDRKRYDDAIRAIDEAPTLADYNGALVALAEAQGRIRNPHRVARAEGRRVEPGEIEAWERRLGIGSYIPQRSINVPSSRSASPNPRWHLRDAEENPVRSQAPAARMRSADISGPSSAPAAREVVREWSDFTITVGPSVFSRIEREIHEAVQAFDTNVETGGWLYAHYTPDAEGVPIIQATGPGPSAKHSASRLRLSHPRELEDELASSAVLVGDWHTHPATWRGDPTDQASEADEEAWKGRLERLASCPRWVGLVFTPGVMGWTCPIYHGFVTHQNEHGVVVCEQATVTEGQISSGWVA